MITIIATKATKQLNAAHTPLEKKIEHNTKKTGYRIRNENGTFHGAGTDAGSWFTLEEARKIKQAGQQIVEHDGVNVLWEVL